MEDIGSKLDGDVEGELRRRLADLGQALLLHWRLDAELGHHRHRLGDALRELATIVQLPVEVVAKAKAIKAAGDLARHAPAFGPVAEEHDILEQPSDLLVCAELAPGLWLPPDPLPQAAAFADGLAAGWHLAELGADTGTKEDHVDEDVSVELLEAVCSVGYKELDLEGQSVVQGELEVQDVVGEPSIEDEPPAHEAGGPVAATAVQLGGASLADEALQLQDGDQPLGERFAHLSLASRLRWQAVLVERLQTALDVYDLAVMEAPMAHVEVQQLVIKDISMALARADAAVEAARGGPPLPDPVRATS